MAIINISDVTEGIVTGNGSFDKIMASLNAQLQKEFDAHRIKQTEYANVYLSALQSALTQSIAFELGKQGADKAADQIDSDITNSNAQAAQDLLLTQAKIDLIVEQTESENKSNEVNGVIDLQKLDIQSTTTVREAQSTQDILNKQQDLILTTSKTTSEDKINALNGVIDNQILEIIAGTSLTDNKSASELKSALDIVSTTSSRDEQSAQDLLNKGEALLKTTTEINLLTQKTLTEEAQTLNVLSDGTTVFNTTTKEGLGLSGKQQALYVRQSDGFLRDAEQKAARIYADNFAIRRTTNSAEDVSGTGMTDPDIKLALDKLQAGVP